MKSWLPTDRLSRQLAILGVVIFAEPMAMFILYPFMYFMVRDFGVVEDERDLGWFVGLVAASFSLAQFLTSVPWGWCSNHIGRRPVILVGLLGNFLTMTAFGMSRTFEWAVATRLASGLLNGNIAVAKVTLAEICSEEQQSRAFSMFGFLFGLGSMVAPTLGGLLARPAEQYPSVFGNVWLFREFPYLLPCLLSACVSLIGFAVGYFYLEESLVKLRRRRQQQPDADHSVADEFMNIMLAADEESNGGERPISTPLNDERASMVSVSERASSRYTTVSSHSRHSLISQSVFNLDQEDDAQSLDLRPVSRSSESASNYQSIGAYTDDDERLLSDQVSTASSGRPISVFRAACATITGYTILAFTQITFQETYVLWCQTDRKYGGLSWSSAEVGTSLAMAGVLLLIFQMIIFPMMSAKYGYRRLYFWSWLVSVPLFFVTAFMADIRERILAGQHSEHAADAALWTLTALHHLVRVACQTFAFTSIMIMINNSATPETLGVVNGIGQMSASGIRAVGPALGGLMWQYSLKSELAWPLNYHFVFVVLTLVSIFGAFAASIIPKSCDRRRSDVMAVHAE